MTSNIPKKALGAIVASASLAIGGVACSSGSNSDSPKETTTTLPSPEIYTDDNHHIVDGGQGSGARYYCEGISVVIGATDSKKAGLTTVSGTETARCWDGNPELSAKEAEINAQLQRKALEGLYLG